MATLNSLEKEGRQVVLLFSQEAPRHCGQKTRNAANHHHVIVTCNPEKGEDREGRVRARKEKGRRE